MNHTESFEKFRAERARQRAAEVRVTWRRVSADTGGGYSGIGPAGIESLVFVKRDRLGSAWVFGKVVAGRRVAMGTRGMLSEAKAAAAALLTAEGSVRS